MLAAGNDEKRTQIPSAAIEAAKGRADRIYAKALPVLLMR
jgi:hypothetical protein